MEHGVEWSADRLARRVAHARSLVRGESTSLADALELLTGREPIVPIAFLVSFGRSEGDVVLPLARGRTAVGRGSSDAPRVAWPKSPLVEQAQWLIECERGSARICDSGSTNGSLLVPASEATRAHETRFGLAALEEVPGIVRLRHPNQPDGGFALRWCTLRAGDALRSAYASFVFDWVE